MKRTFLPTVLVFLAAIALAGAQSQSPMVVVPAVGTTPVTQPAVGTPAAAAGSDSTQTALKALELMKAANDDLLKRQAATLQQLEDAEKAAEQMKIYSKRG